MQKSEDSQDLKISFQISSMNSKLLNTHNLLKGFYSSDMEMNYTDRVEKTFANLDYDNKKQQEIEESVDAMRHMLLNFQKLADLKIFQLYPEMRISPKDLQQQSATQIAEALSHQKQFRGENIIFQEIQIREIESLMRTLDENEKIEFTLPVEIDQMKKKIQIMEKEININKIKQSHKSTILVNVEKVNDKQFEKTSILRSSIEKEVKYQLICSERQAILDDKIYDIQSRKEALDNKFQQLMKIAKEKKLEVSSNKELVHLKQRKTKLEKSRDQIRKRSALNSNNLSRETESIRKQSTKAWKQYEQKQKRMQQVQKQLQVVKQKNKEYLNDDKINSLMKKSFSFHYADTLLKMNKKQMVKQPPKDISKLANSLLLKPNFKVNPKTKRYLNNKSTLISNNSKNQEQLNITLPITHLQSNPEKEKIEDLQIFEQKKVDDKNIRKNIIQDQFDEQIIIEE